MNLLFTELIIVGDLLMNGINVRSGNNLSVLISLIGTECIIYFN